MFRIRKKRPSQRPPLISAPRQDPGLPVQLTRAFLFSVRYAHAWQKLVVDAYRSMPVEWQPHYKTWADIELRPTFDEVIQLIQEAQRQGLITEDEAVSLRAGKSIELHFTSEESQPVLAAQSTRTDSRGGASGDTTHA